MLSARTVLGYQTEPASTVAPYDRHRVTVTVTYAMKRIEARDRLRAPVDDLRLRRIEVDTQHPCPPEPRDVPVTEVHRKDVRVGTLSIDADRQHRTIPG